MIKNNLPTKLVLYVAKQYSHDPKIFTTINSHEVKTFPPSQLKNKDKLYAYVYINEFEDIPKKENNNILHLLLQPYVITDRWKTIILGDINYGINVGSSFENLISEKDSLIK